MRTVSIPLKAHLAQQYHTLATCWRVTLPNGDIRAYTNHDQDLVIDGLTYIAASGYTDTDVETSDAMNVDNLEVQGMTMEGAMTEEELSVGDWDYAQIQIFIVNWADLTQGTMMLRNGRLGEVSLNAKVFRAELRGLMQHYTRVIGEITSPTCRASLGDHRCQVDLTPFTHTGTVDSVDPDNQTIFDTERTEEGPAGGADINHIAADGPDGRATVTLVTLSPSEYSAYLAGTTVAIHGVSQPALINGLHRIYSVDTSGIVLDLDISDTGVYPPYTSGGVLTRLGDESGYFDFGVITFTSGLNAGRSMEIKQNMPGMLTLALPMPYAIAGAGSSSGGDTYTAVAGCDKHITTCIEKFNNVVNFRGEPYLPGRDKIAQVGRRG